MADDSLLEERRVVILADGSLDFHHGKTTASLLRHRPQDVVAVVDTEHRGMTTDQVLGIGGDIPILGDVSDAVPQTPTVLLLGIAPRGGVLPASWREQILFAIRQGWDVMSGLHFMLNEDREFAEAAQSSRVALIDVRRPPDTLSVADMKAHPPGCNVVTFVGSDCAVGKMTAALEIWEAAERRGLDAAFVATGQTGIMLQGHGIAIDRVIGDFMAGAAERLVQEACASAEFVFVEGQGSLFHPAYSGVTLALLHGSLPDALILVHRAGHDEIEEYGVPIPPLTELVRVYQEAASWVKPAPVVGIALNTRGLRSNQTRETLAEAEQATGLPVSDPVKDGGEKLIDALCGYFDSADDRPSQRAAHAR